MAEQLKRGAAARARRTAAGRSARTATGEGARSAANRTKRGAAARTARGSAETVEQTADASRAAPTGRRRPRRPLIEIGRAKREQDALAGFDRWKKRHREAAAHLQPADVLVDAMRGRYSTWTRIRVNLEHVPPDLRPDQEPLDPNENTRSSS